MKIIMAALGGLAVLSIPTVACADPITGFIFNNEVYEQTGTTVPTAVDHYFFSIGAQQSLGNYSSAAVTYPGPGSPQPLPLISPTEFNQNFGNYPNLGALQAAFPFGNYTITATNGVTSAQSTVSYTANYFTNAIPNVSTNLAALDPTVTNIINFNSFTPNGANTQGYTFFSIYNGSGTEVSDGFLAPSTTSILLPANTLVAGTQYNFELDFSDRIGGNGDPTLGFDVRTDGTFTAGVSAVPELSTWAMLIIGFTGLGFVTYRRKSTFVSMTV